MQTSRINYQAGGGGEEGEAEVMNYTSYITGGQFNKDTTLVNFYTCNLQV